MNMLGLSIVVDPGDLSRDADNGFLRKPGFYPAESAPDDFFNRLEDSWFFGSEKNSSSLGGVPLRVCLIIADKSLEKVFFQKIHQKDGAKKWSIGFVSPADNKGVLDCKKVLKAELAKLKIATTGRPLFKGLFLEKEALFIVYLLFYNSLPIAGSREEGMKDLDEARGIVEKQPEEVSAWTRNIFPFLAKILFDIR